MTFDRVRCPGFWEGRVQVWIKMEKTTSKFCAFKPPISFKSFQGAIDHFGFSLALGILLTGISQIRKPKKKLHFLGNFD